jgi:biopolymer transport protein ExbB
MHITEAFKEGGWGMYPILAMLIMILAITIDRAMTLSKATVDVDKLLSLIKSQIVSGNVRGAISTCEGSPAPLTKIVAAGLRKADGTEHEIQQAMDEEALRELPKIEKRTGYLAMLGNLATLAGLLGTITGLGAGILGLAVFAWLNGKTQGILDGINRGCVEALNLVVAGRTHQ